MSNQPAGYWHDNNVNRPIQMNQPNSVGEIASLAHLPSLIPLRLSATNLGPSEGIPQANPTITIYSDNTSPSPTTVTVTSEEYYDPSFVDTVREMSRTIEMSRTVPSSGIIRDFSQEQVVEAAYPLQHISINIGEMLSPQQIINLPLSDLRVTIEEIIDNFRNLTAQEMRTLLERRLLGITTEIEARDINERTDRSPQRENQTSPGGVFAGTRHRPTSPIHLSESTPRGQESVGWLTPRERCSLLLRRV